MQGEVAVGLCLGDVQGFEEYGREAAPVRGVLVAVGLPLFGVCQGFVERTPVEGHALLLLDVSVVVFPQQALQGEGGTADAGLYPHFRAVLGLAHKAGVVAAQAVEQQVGDGGLAAAVVAPDDVHAGVEAFVVGHLPRFGEHVEAFYLQISIHRIYILGVRYGVSVRRHPAGG